MTKRLTNLLPGQVCDCDAVVHPDGLAIIYVGPRVGDQAFIDIPREKALELARAIIEIMEEGDA